MATFAGPTSPTALAALAPSITNLATAQRAKSQAAAGLMNTLGVQFEKQKQQEARKQKNQAAQQVAEGLLKDEAFRRQVPGISTSADLVKLVGAENVIEYGMKSQQADRLAQQSAAQIALTQKQISEYDRQAKQRETDLAAEKAEGEAFQQLVSASGKLSDEQLGSVLSGLSPEAQVRAIALRNQLDPEQAYTMVDLPNGEKAMLYGNQMMRISTQEKSELPDSYVKGLALIKDQFKEGTPEYQRAVQNLTDRTLGYDVSLGESAFGGQPAGGAVTGVPVQLTEDEAVLYERIPDNIFTEDNMVDPEVLEAELAKMDFLSPQEAERIRQFAAQESVNRRRKAYLDATGEKPNLDATGEKPNLGGDKVISEMQRGISLMTQPGRNPAPATSLITPPTTPPDPRLQSIQQARAIQKSPISEVRLQDRALKQRQAAFKNAKELARMELIEKYKGKDKKQILEELEKARLDKIMSMPKTSAQTPAQRKVHELLKNMFQMPPFVEQYGLDELPSEIAKFVRDMIPVTERERLRRERSNRNQSTVTPVE